MKKRLFIVFMLGFSSGLPFALVTSTLQAWFASSRVSILATGALSLLGIPYFYRFMWGPLLDRYTLFAIGKRRSWMLSMQLLLLVSFNLMAWCSPTTSPGLLSFVAVMVACFSATQDIAIDAHRTEYLFLGEHGLGASLAVFGYRLALLVAGGLALIIASHFGWAVAYRIMGLLMLFGIFTTLWSPEPSLPMSQQTSLAEALIAPIKALYFRNGILAILCFIFCYKLGEAFTTTTSGIVMPFLIQGIGFSLDTIAYINKMLGIASVLLGGIISGLLLLRWSLYQALLVFGLMQAFTNLLFILLAIIGKNVPLFATAVIADNLVAGMGSTALVALIMRLVNKKYTTTHFSIFVAIGTLPGILSGPLAGLLQIRFGWTGVYQFAFILSFSFIPFLFAIRKYIQPRDNQQGVDPILLVQ